MNKLPWPNLFDVDAGEPIPPGTVWTNHMMGEDRVVSAKICTWNKRYRGLVCFFGGTYEVYYYMPMSRKREKIKQEIQTIVDLMRAGGVQVDEDIVENIVWKGGR